MKQVIRILEYLYLALFIAIVVGVLFLIYYDNFSEMAITGKEYERKAEKLDIGMSTATMLKIMGEPNVTVKYHTDSLTEYSYPSSNESHNVSVYIDNNDRVVRITNPR